MRHFLDPDCKVEIWNPTIWNPETIGIQTFWRSDFKWSDLSHGYVVPTIKKNIQNLDTFIQILNGCWKNGSHLSTFQMIGLPDFRSHWKSGPFETQPLINQLKSRLVQISDPHCIWICPFNFKDDRYLYPANQVNENISGTATN